MAAQGRVKQPIWHRVPVFAIALTLWPIALITAIVGNALGSTILIAVSLGCMVLAGAVFLIPRQNDEQREDESRRRLREGRCVFCGYMLRGLDYGARSRCPECGKKQPARSG